MGNKTGPQRQRPDNKWFKEMEACTRERNSGIEKPKKEDLASKRMSNLSRKESMDVKLS
jgi:hypothetical protein